MYRFSFNSSFALVPAARMTSILLLSFLAITGGIVACAGQNAAPISIRFTVPDSADSTLADLRFYVHDIELLTNEGQARALRLKPDNQWQSERVGLIDLIGADRNEVVTGFIDGEVVKFTGIRFVLGVPFDLNHANALQATAPLNRADLFWSWQSGYKFLRLDVREKDRERAFHLGSTGCSSASALRPPLQPCAQPNVVKVELRGFDPMTQPVVFNVGELVVVLADAEQACTGDYTSPACSAAFAITGLDPQVGRCDGVCGTQRLFGVARD
jgi:uncharacterized repeat protein (TIGR04052 family)